MSEATIDPSSSDASDEDSSDEGVCIISIWPGI